MGLLNRLFGNRSQGDAALPEERDAFCEFIAREGAWLVAREIKGQDISFVDYIAEDGQHMWPLFSTQDTAATWVSQSGATGVTPFPCLQFAPEAVVNLVPAGARVIFDAKSPYERVLAEEDLLLVKRLIASRGQSDD